MSGLSFRTACVAVVCSLPWVTWADTPSAIAQHYVQSAPAGFVPSVQRGEKLFRQAFGVSETMPACTSCHTERPTQNGQHAVTGKTIRPLAVAANSARFTDPAKVEKWFGRNCREVIGRDCTASEKADFVTWASEVR